MPMMSAVPLRNFSAPAHPASASPAADDGVQMQSGFVERPLQALDMAMVRQIKAQLMEIDANKDGRIDSDELKKLLEKHGGDAFTKEEIAELGDLYYAGKAGGSVRFDKFIEAIDRVAARSASVEMSPRDVGDDGQHFRESGRHPLGIGRDGMEFVGLGKPHGHYTAEELDVKLTHVAPKGIVDRMAYNSVRVVRVLFDAATNWKNDNITVNNVLNRTIYLETIAAVPGMVAVSSLVFLLLS